MKMSTVDDFIQCRYTHIYIYIYMYIYMYIFTFDDYFIADVSLFIHYICSVFIWYTIYSVCIYICIYT